MAAVGIVILIVDEIPYNSEPASGLASQRSQ
jgi:hypothetical protein